MRATASLSQLAVLALSLSPAVSAWQLWPRFLPNVDTLVVRQDAGSTTQATRTADATTEPTGTTKKAIPTTNLNTGGIATASATGTGTLAKGNSTKTSGPRKTMYNPQDPAGGVVMLTPAATDDYQLYKLKKEFITFAWNYTNLQGTPTAVDVLVSCSAASQTWTLTQNMTFTTKAAYVWDIEKFQNENIKSQLPTQQYTLVIHDSDSAITEASEPGYLSPFTNFVFGLYMPREAVPLSIWECVSCSGAMSMMEVRALSGVLAMSAVTVLTFTWFVAGFGALL